jgi:hypothetical protein
MASFVINPSYSKLCPVHCARYILLFVNGYVEGRSAIFERPETEKEKV